MNKKINLLLKITNNEIVIKNRMVLKNNIDPKHCNLHNNNGNVHNFCCRTGPFLCTLSMI